MIKKCIQCTSNKIYSGSGSQVYRLLTISDKTKVKKCSYKLPYCLTTTVCRMINAMCRNVLDYTRKSYRKKWKFSFG